jgi:hypothetical protein
MNKILENFLDMITGFLVQVIAEMDNASLTVASQRITYP